MVMEEDTQWITDRFGMAQLNLLSGLSGVILQKYKFDYKCIFKDFVTEI